MNSIGLHGKFEKINENFLNETFDVFGDHSEEIWKDRQRHDY